MIDSTLSRREFGQAAFPMATFIAGGMAGANPDILRGSDQTAKNKTQRKPYSRDELSKLFDAYYDEDIIGKLDGMKQDAPAIDFADEVNFHLGDLASLIKESIKLKKISREASNGLVQLAGPLVTEIVNFAKGLVPWVEANIAA